MNELNSKIMTNRKYGGMTVNERLYVAGLLDEYYKAIEKKDILSVKKILSKVDIDGENVTAILKNHKLI